jgi:hypothetical protein
VQVRVLCLLSLNGSNYLLGGRQHQPHLPTPDFLTVVQAGTDPQTVRLSPPPQQLADHFATLAGSTRTRPLNFQLHALSQDTTCHKSKRGTKATCHAKSDGDTVATQPQADVCLDSSEGLDSTSESKVIFFFILLIYSYSLF